MDDMRSRQWFVKVYYNGNLIEVKEIWSDTEAMAQIYAHKLATSSFETQMETPEETKQRVVGDKLSKLQQQRNDLCEFLYDDYGDSVDQLGMEKVEELEEELRRIDAEIACLDKIDVELRQEFGIPVCA